MIGFEASLPYPPVVPKGEEEKDNYITFTAGGVQHMVVFIR